MNYLIGLDIGTSAVKGALMEQTGRILGTKSAPFTYFGENGCRFLDPDAFSEVCFSVIRQLADMAGQNAHISAVCSCCASGDPVLLDAQNKPITPIIGWQTRVTQDVMDAVYSKEELNAFYRNCGWPIDLEMPAAYLAWMKLNRPDLLKDCAVVTMSAEYMNFKMTGAWGISHSMGTPSYLMLQEKGEYNMPLLEKFGIENKFYPPIHDKGTVLGTVRPDMVDRLGVSDDTAVVLGTFDHPSGAMGAGVLKEGQMLLSCGTSWVEFFPVSDREFALSTGGLVDRFLLHGAPYCVMKSLDSVSDRIAARKAHFFGDISFSDFDALASKSSLGCNGLTFDYTDNDYTAAEGYAPEDIARAIYEGAAIRLRNNLEHLKSCGLYANEITVVGGITNSSVCTGIISETLGIPLSTVNGQSAGAVGSCLLAGMGVGFFTTEQQAFDAMMAANA